MTLSYNLAPLKTILVHLTRRQIFANTVQPHWTQDLTPRLMGKLFNFFNGNGFICFIILLYLLVVDQEISSPPGKHCLLNKKVQTMSKSRRRQYPTGAHLLHRGCLPVLILQTVESRSFQSCARNLTDSLLHWEVVPLCISVISSESQATILDLI